MSWKLIPFWLTGVGFGVFLMVGDEIIGNLYAHVPTYVFPVNTVVSAWVAWIIVFSAVLLCVVAAMAFIAYFGENKHGTHM